MKPIPYGKQHITQTDIDAVTKALQSDFLTQGPTILEFEKNFAEYVQATFAVAVSNGTAALHLAALSLGLQKGQKVISTPITFAASTNAILYCGAEVVFADINPQTFLIDLQQVEELCKNDPAIVGIIPVDFAGYPIQADELRAIAEKYNLWIVEDACHAPGAIFTDSQNQKQTTGNGKYSDFTVFSFHPVKHIAAGEGGMITTNNEELFKKLLALRTHGITKDPDVLIENHGGWYYEMHDLGYNYRITDIQAALGNSQLKRANDGIIRRNEIAKIYTEAFKSIPNLTTPFCSNSVTHAYHLYVIQVPNRKELYDYLRTKNIFTQVHYIPVHTLPYYQKLGFKKGDLPNAEKYYNGCLSLPMFPSLTNDEQDFIIKIIQEFYS